VTLSQATGRPYRAVSANLICMASMLIWSAGLPAADVLIGKLPPLTITGIRMALAGLALIPVWWAMEGRAALRGAPWGRGILVGGLGFGFCAFLILLAQAWTDAVTVAVILATMPVVGIALECLLDGRRLTIATVAGVILSLAGGLVAYAARMGSFSLGLGALAAFGSVFAYTWGSRATVVAFPMLSSMGRATITLAGAGIATALAAAAAVAVGIEPAPDWTRVGWPEVAAMAVYAIGSLSVTQALWIMAVGHLGIGAASMHMNATPFYVMLFLFALGGGWNWIQALGAVIVVLGVLVAQGLLPPRRP